MKISEIDGGINTLIEKYFNQIQIEDTDYVPVNGAVSDAAYLLLNIPIQMLQEYSKLKGQNTELPDGAEFWRKTELRKRLKNSDRYPSRGHEPLEDILDFLGGEVWGEYQRLGNSERIRLSITEVPEFYED